MKTSAYFGTVLMGFFEDMTSLGLKGYINEDIGDKTLTTRLKTRGLSIGGTTVIARDAIEIGPQASRRNEWLRVGQESYGLVHTLGGEAVPDVQQIMKLQIQELYGDGPYGELVIRIRDAVREKFGFGEEQGRELGEQITTFVRGPLAKLFEDQLNIQRGAYFGINVNTAGDTSIVGPSLVVMSADNEWTTRRRTEFGGNDGGSNWNKNVYRGTYGQWKSLEDRAQQWRESDDFFEDSVFYKTGEETYWRGIKIADDEDYGLIEKWNSELNKREYEKLDVVDFSSTGMRMDCVHGMIRSIGMQQWRSHLRRENRRSKAMLENVKRARHFEVSSTSKTTKSGACIACAMYMTATEHGFSHLHLGASENWSLPWERDPHQNGEPVLISPNNHSGRENYFDLEQWDKKIKEWFISGSEILRRGGGFDQFCVNINQKIKSEWRNLDRELATPDVLAGKADYVHGQLLLESLRLGLKVKDILKCS